MLQRISFVEKKEIQQKFCSSHCCYKTTRFICYALYYIMPLQTNTRTVKQKMSTCTSANCSSGIWHYITGWLVPASLKPLCGLKQSCTFHPVRWCHIREGCRRKLRCCESLNPPWCNIPQGLNFPMQVHFWGKALQKYNVYKGCSHQHTGFTIQVHKSFSHTQIQGWDARQQGSQTGWIFNMSHWH